MNTKPRFSTKPSCQKWPVSINMDPLSSSKSKLTPTWMSMRKCPNPMLLNWEGKEREVCVLCLVWRKKKRCFCPDFEYHIFPSQVIWDPAVSLLVNLWPDQPLRDQRGRRPSVHGVRRRHHVRHLQHHLAGGAPEHAHSHDEQLLPAHCCERTWNTHCDHKELQGCVE